MGLLILKGDLVVVNKDSNTIIYTVSDFCGHNNSFVKLKYKSNKQMVSGGTVHYKKLMQPTKQQLENGRHYY